MEAKSRAEIEKKVSPNHFSIKDKQNSKQSLFEKILDKLHHSSGNPSTRVPQKYREPNSNIPQIVSIGPFHRKRNCVKIMEEHKWRYMQSFLERTSSKLEEPLKRCSADILNLDSQVRQNYPETTDNDFNFKPPDVAGLAEIMLLDGCFILEIFLRYKSRDFHGNTNDPMLDNALWISDLRHDLAILENQIPFIVLEVLSDIILLECNPEFQGRPSISIITNLALFFFHSDPHLAAFSVHFNSSEMNRSESSYKHLLHLLHDFQQPMVLESSKLRPTATKELEHGSLLTDSLAGRGYYGKELERERLLSVFFKNNNKKQKEETILGFSICATSLLEEGIDFERDTEAYPGRLLPFTFSNGVIKIPPLHIKQTTESLLRNLIAFEQCSVFSSHPIISHHITSYVILLKSLIRSSEDVQLLEKKKIIIIDSGRSAEDILSIFNSISTEVALKDFCFRERCDEVNEYRTSYWHWHRHKLIWKVRCQKYWKILRSDYFSSPWSIISFIAAVVLLILAALQTYYTIYPN